VFTTSPWFRAFVACFASIGAVAVASTALAQANKPNLNPNASNTSSNELRSIYRDDVGDGFTGQSLNQISLQNARDKVGNYGQASFNNRSQGSLSASRVPALGAGNSAKPFAGVSSSPTVSPYLNLFRDDLDGSSDFNYQTLVRPQFQQMATNQQFQRQNTELTQRVQSISAQSAYRNPAGSETLYPTGHQTAFGYYGNYYPGMAHRGR
jgi:hypothetical protein